MDIITTLRQRAREKDTLVILPESLEERVLHAASTATKEKISRIMLIGNPDEIRAKASSVGADISLAEIIDPEHYEKKNEMINTLYNLRKHKGMTQEEAAELIKNPIYFSATLVKMDVADGYVAGSITSTPNVLRPALQIIKTAPDAKIVSAYFIMVLDDESFGYKGMLIYADCGLIENPSADELSEISIQSAKTFSKIVSEDVPRVAMLSYSSKGSASGQLVDKVVTATQLAKQKAPDISIDGELQLDSALIEKVARFKVGESPVAGKANVLIFPDLNAGNISYKLTERLAGAKAIGPLTQGLAKPANDLSRGCSAEDIVNVVALTSIDSK